MKKRGPILFYDGDCGFCNHVVKFVLNHEINKTLKFASLQSPIAQNFLAMYVDQSDYYDSFKIMSGEVVYTKSTAFFFLIRNHLNWPWKPLLLLSILPKSWCDWVYDRIAANRYSLAVSHCVLPTADQRERFLG